MRIEVDRIACRGDGLCAGLLPEAVVLDDWGFPIVGPLPPGSEKAARRAVAACPALALRLEASRLTSPSGRGAARTSGTGRWPGCGPRPR